MCVLSTNTRGRFAQRRNFTAGAPEWRRLRLSIGEGGQKKIVQKGSVRVDRKWYNKNGKNGLIFELREHLFIQIVQSSTSYSFFWTSTQSLSCSIQRVTLRTGRDLRGGCGEITTDCSFNLALVNEQIVKLNTVITIDERRFSRRTGKSQHPKHVIIVNASVFWWQSKIQSALPCLTRALPQCRVLFLIIDPRSAHSHRKLYRSGSCHNAWFLGLTALVICRAVLLAWVFPCRLKTNLVLVVPNMRSITAP